VPNDSDAGQVQRTYLSISEAARRTGKARTTIQKACKDGRISLTRQADGSKAIEILELLRVFGPLQDDAPASRSSASQETAVAPMVDALQAQRLEGRVETLEAVNEQLRHQVERLERDLADAKNERNRLIGIIEQRMLAAPADEDIERPSIVEMLGLGKKAQCPHCGEKMKTSKLEKHIRDRHV
jgi:hypothetical protein